MAQKRLTNSEPVNVTPPAPAAVIEWLISGAGEDEIVRSLRQKFPTVDVRKTIAKVQEDLAAEGENVAAIRGWALVSYREIYRRMLQDGDLAGAAKVLRYITDLVGL